MPFFEKLVRSVIIAMPLIVFKHTAVVYSNYMANKWLASPVSDALIQLAAIYTIKPAAKRGDSSTMYLSNQIKFHLSE